MTTVMMMNNVREGYCATDARQCTGTEYLKRSLFAQVIAYATGAVVQQNSCAHSESGNSLQSSVGPIHRY